MSGTGAACMRESWRKALCKAPRNSLACCIRSQGQWGLIKKCRQGVIELSFHFANILDLG